MLCATDADWVFDEVDAALGGEGTSVYRVRAGAHVVSAAAEVNPSLVVLDLQIGNMGGMAASLALQQSFEGRDTDCPKILMLLDRGADSFVGGIAKADGWLIKPLNSLRLKRAADALLAGDEVREAPDVINVEVP